MTNKSVHADQFNALDATIQAELDKWNGIGETLVESWRASSTSRVHDMVPGELLKIWKDNLTPEKATHYIHAFASPLRSTLLDCYAESTGPTEGYLIVMERQAIQAEFRVPEDSRYAREVIHSGGFARLEEPVFFQTLRTDCGSGYAQYAVLHIAESLRTRELTQLAGLELTMLTPSIIKVTLDMKEDYNLG